MKKAAILFLLSFTLTAAACSSKTKEAEGPAAAEEETIYPILVDKSMLTEEPTEIDTGGPAASYSDSVKIYGTTIEIGETHYHDLAVKGFSTQETENTDQTIYEWEEVKIPFVDGDGNKVTFYFQGDTSQPVMLYDARVSGFFMEGNGYQLSDEKQRLIGCAESADSSSESTIRLVNAFGVENGYVHVMFKDDGTPKQIEYHVDNINF